MPKAILICVKCQGTEFHHVTPDCDGVSYCHMHVCSKCGEPESKESIHFINPSSAAQEAIEKRARQCPQCGTECCKAILTDVSVSPPVNFLLCRKCGFKKQLPQGALRSMLKPKEQQPKEVA
jgi:hypothetical protein